MIIQIRGTSGSGKSTIVKTIMELYAKPWRKVYREGRRQPLYYRLTHPKSFFKPELAVIGHYEAKCGGCDTISIPGQSYPIIFDLIKRNIEDGRDVLFEGLLISGDVKWTGNLVETTKEILIIELSTSLEECLESINDRRKVRLGEKFIPVNPENTASKHKLITRSCERLNKEFGIKIELHSRNSALLRVKELLNV